MQSWAVVVVSRGPVDRMELSHCSSSWPTYILNAMSGSGCLILAQPLADEDQHSEGSQSHITEGEVKELGKINESYREAKDSPLVGTVV